jgi:predicted esterase YcpF (UPF0227 family)
MIIYLHGLNSAGSSAKAAVLRKALRPIEVLSPTYPVQQADEAVARLSELIQNKLPEMSRINQPIILVGSSMGGFYGQYLARRFAVDHLVMINPALEPWELLRQVAGWQYNEALNERYYLSQEMIAATRRYAIDKVDDGVPTSLLLDQGDELIDWRIASSIYSGVAQIHCFKDGNHAFGHMREAVVIIQRIHQALSLSSGS